MIGLQWWSPSAYAGIVANQSVRESHSSAPGRARPLTAIATTDCRRLEIQKASPDIMGPAKSNQETSMSGEIIEVSDGNFDEKVLNADGPVLVDYWASWCGPCKMIAPILEDLAKEYGEKLTIAKLNIDDNPETPKKYGVRGIPTLTVFKNGNVEATKVGALSKSQLTAFLDSTL
jgi:thioredoxin 1